MSLVNPNHGSLIRTLAGPITRPDVQLEDGPTALDIDGS